jgi:hypothetical protein
MSFSVISVWRPWTTASEYTGSLLRSQTYVFQFRSYHELDRSLWRQGSTNSYSFRDWDFSMSGHTRDITPPLDISSQRYPNSSISRNSLTSKQANLVYIGATASPCKPCGRNQ